MTDFSFTTVLSQWDFSHGEIRVAFPGESQLRQSCYSTYGACWMFECFHNPLNSDMDYGIFKVRTDVIARGCTRGCTNTVGESALKVDPGRKIPSCTGQSNLRRRRVCPMLYQLSYILNFLCFSLIIMAFSADRVFGIDDWRLCLMKLCCTWLISWIHSDLRLSGCECQSRVLLHAVNPFTAMHTCTVYFTE